MIGASEFATGNERLGDAAPGGCVAAGQDELSTPGDRQGLMRFIIRLVLFLPKNTNEYKTIYMFWEFYSCYTFNFLVNINN